MTPHSDPRAELAGNHRVAREQPPAGLGEEHTVLVLCDLFPPIESVDATPCLSPEDLRRSPRATRQVVGLVVRSDHRIDPALLNRFPALRFIVRAGSGVDNIDLAELRRREIVLRRNPTLSAGAVAELAWMGLTALARRLPLAMAHTARRAWAKSRLVGESTSELEVAIWGAGPVGKAIFDLSQGRCARARFADWPSLPHGLPRTAPPMLVATAAAHFVCLPARADTERFVGEGFLAEARSSRPYIVVMGRAATVDLPAALRSLRDGNLRGLFIDPIEQDQIDIAAEALKADPPTNLLVTQHLGAQRRDVLVGMSAWVRAELSELLKQTAE